jgi:protein-disulfide isomerase
MPAAEAVEAAREQGKFWEMHDLMFANQGQLGPEKYKEWAQQLQLDMGKFNKSVESHANQARIQQDSQVGNSVGANGTPAFFINGRNLVGAQPPERFFAIIDEELKNADELLKKKGNKLDAKFYDKIVEENLTKVPAAPKIDVGSSPVKGNPKAPITITEFSDFQ